MNHSPKLATNRPRRLRAIQLNGHKMEANLQNQKGSKHVLKNVALKKHTHTFVQFLFYILAAPK